MKIGISVLVLCTSLGLLNAQKMVKKSVLNPNVTAVFIDTEDCYKVEVSTTPLKGIVVEAFFDGEYQNAVELGIKEEGRSLNVSAGFQPSFTLPVDKLSAHKVISIALRVMLPEDMKVSLYGTNTNVYVQGRYKELQVTLDDGTCNIQGINGNAHVLTRSGDIHVFSKGATIETKNSFGNTETGNLPKGDDYFKLVTTTGNIYVRKTE